jgi:hypothetical protein
VDFQIKDYRFILEFIVQTESEITAFFSFSVINNKIVDENVKTISYLKNFWLNKTASSMAGLKLRV